MYTLIVDVVEDLVGWRVSVNARLGSGRRVVTLVDEVWHCEMPSGDRLSSHARLQTAVREEALRSGQHFLEIACGHENLFE